MTSPVKFDPTSDVRVAHGDIIKDIDLIEYAVIENGDIATSKIQFPLAIILTQDCDLNQDYEFRNPEKDSHDKILMSILVAPVYNSDLFFKGEHLSRIGLKMQKFIGGSPTKIDLIKTNQIPRYHYLKCSNDAPIVESVIDFKHYFSVNVKYIERLKVDNFIGRISSLYREDISQRFSAFLARIALPD